MWSTTSFLEIAHDLHRRQLVEVTVISSGEPGQGYIYVEALNLDRSSVTLLLRSSRSPSDRRWRDQLSILNKGEPGMSRIGHLSPAVGSDHGARQRDHRFSGHVVLPLKSVHSGIVCDCTGPLLGNRSRAVCLQGVDGSDQCHWRS